MKKTSIFNIACIQKNKFICVKLVSDRNTFTQITNYGVMPALRYYSIFRCNHRHIRGTRKILIPRLVNLGNLLL